MLSVYLRTNLDSTLIYRDDVIGLSPAYDLLNTTIALPNPEEELVLPINGKKNRLKR